MNAEKSDLNNEINENIIRKWVYESKVGGINYIQNETEDKMRILREDSKLKKYKKRKEILCNTCL